MARLGIFRDRSVRLRYPPTWHAYSYADDTSSFSVALVYLSNLRLHDPCLTAAGPPLSKTCQSPLHLLTPRSILVSWRASGLIGWSLARTRGTPLQVDGHQAKLTRKHATCAMHADLEINIVIQRASRGNWYSVTACIRGPGIAQLAGQFTSMLKTARVAP